MKTIFVRLINALIASNKYISISIVKNTCKVSTFNHHGLWAWFGEMKSDLIEMKENSD